MLNGVILRHMFTTLRAAAEERAHKQVRMF